MLKRQDGMRFEKKVRVPLADDPIWSEEERSYLEDINARISSLTGSPPHKDEVVLVGMLTPGGSDGAISDHLGLHVDTNAAEWRFCTVIIYLSSVSDGGETVFPAAVSDNLPTEDEEVAVEAAGRLLSLGIDHTDRAETREAASAAKELLNAASMGTGLKMKPEEGSACVFWTRRDDGEIDCHSWHGGAPVPTGGLKWTLQKFKEVPLDVRSDGVALADFCRRTRFSTLPR